MTLIPKASQIIKQAIENKLLDVHTAIVGKVERYDERTNLADIKPLLKTSEHELPLLIDVPILYLKAGDFFVSLPVKKDDFVQIIFNESSIDSLFENAPSKIDFTGRFTLSGAIAIPFSHRPIQSVLGANKEGLILGKENGVKVHVSDEKICLGSDKASEALAIASSVKQELEKIKAAFEMHVHTSHGTPTTTRIAPIGDIATTKVVAE